MLAREARVFQRRTRAVFLDRDGVINKALLRQGRPYPPQTLEELEVLPGVAEALSTLDREGFLLLVVTNQPDVARGTQSRRVVEAMHSHLRCNLPIAGFYVCYHDDSDNCDCRKPRPGLLLRAALEHNISLKDSFMVGDRWRDIDCGFAAHCTTILVGVGYSESLRCQPHFKAVDLLAASALITSLKGQ